MNIDVVIGPPGEEQAISFRHHLGAKTLSTVSPLAAIEEIRNTLGPTSKIGLLRIFLVHGESQFPTSQLARLRGLFGAGGSVEIFVPSPGRPSGPSTAGNTGASGFAGQANFGGFNMFGSSNFAGQSGFGGFNFSGNFSGGAASSLLGGELMHLTGILSVPVKLSQP
jgi:hypothetical protein